MIYVHARKCFLQKSYPLWVEVSSFNEDLSLDMQHGMAFPAPEPPTSYCWVASRDQLGEIRDLAVAREPDRLRARSMFGRVRAKLRMKP